mmetsp:Transcript_20039/g.29798  ORF Transcript_20039/g.29798 Transcript_20039/m.29798 type:complete len:217 (-) Transcript_20039:328-978(-)
MLYGRWCIRIVKMNGGETKSIEEAIGGLTLKLSDCSDTSTHVDWGFLSKSTSRVDVVKQNDGTNHAAQAKHVCLIRLEFFLANHFFAHVGHDLECLGDVVFGDGGVCCQEFGGGVVDYIHHGRWIRKEERHAVGELVLDDNVHVLLRQLHAVKRAAVVREIVLDGWVHHLEIVKAQHKVKNFGNLLDERLALLEHYLWVVFAQCSQQLWETFLQLQ